MCRVARHAQPEQAPRNFLRPVLSRRQSLRKVMPPTAEVRDVGSAAHGIWFADEALHRGPIIQHSVANAERRRHPRNKAAELVLRHGPYLPLDSRTAKLLVADQPGL